MREMRKRDRNILILIAICFSLLGFLTGYLIWGPVHTLRAVVAETEVGYVQKDISVTNFDDDYFLGNQAATDITYLPVPGLGAAPSHRYLVTSQDGYIVVFYVNYESKTGNYLHTVTNTSVSSLPPEEQERLAKGIYIYTEDALFRILEDYGS